MSIKKLSFILLSALSLAALLNGCGSSNKEGGPGGVARVADEATCRACHASSVDPVSATAIVADYLSSAHNTDAAGCEGCHGGGALHNGVGQFPYKNPLASDRCVTCHSIEITGKDLAPLFTLAKASNGAGWAAYSCARCHTASGVGSIHGARVPPTDDCVKCHEVAAPQHGAGVNDNNGVRAIKGEFEKWSHHVTGVNLNPAHCAACHLEGRVVDGKIVIDKTKHRADAKVHLRNADTDADMLWDPASPSFSTMDNFCLSCHDSNGATSTGSQAIQAFINLNNINAAGKTASASNPFGDTISNQYDKLKRPAVVDAKSQFATSNPSHHAVLGKKYSGRTRASGDPRKVDESVLTFNSNSSGALPGARSTIYDAGKFQNDYTTLADAAGEAGTRNGGTTLGDDSTLHCGDCHTVGQYRAADVGTRYNKAVIGAHGSKNEYLLRNNIGTDARHQGVETSASSTGAATGYGTKPYLVCFNCHSFATYGAIGSTTGIAGLNHAGEYSNSTRCNGPYNTIFGDMTGESRLNSTVTITSNAGYGKQSGTTTFGNAYGIQCSNCHNSGISSGNIFGGIHGAKDQTYTDGMGNTTKHIRFMPGLNNVMYVPGTKGGVTGGTSALYAVYSGNRNGTNGTPSQANPTAAQKAAVAGIVGQTFTQMPTLGIVPGVTAANVTVVDGNTVVSTPAYNSSAAVGYTRGSYQYITGGISNDTNWEQKSAQPVAGEYDFRSKSMGCYTLAQSDVLKLTVNGSVSAAGNGRNAYPATNNIQAGANGLDGTTATMFDNWGGCDDHNGAQGAGTAPFRKVLRKTTY